MEVGWDIEIEMAYWAMFLVLVWRAWVVIIQTPLHDVTQHRGTRLEEVLGQLIHFLPRRRIKAGIHADTAGWLSWYVVWRCGHRLPPILIPRCLSIVLN
jgi:hypothetical protein